MRLALFSQKDFDPVCQEVGCHAALKMPVCEYGLSWYITHNKLYHFFQENTIKNLTDRLESTHRELQLLKDKFSDQMAALWIRTNFTTGQLNRLKIVWVTVNTTAEKTSNLTAKVRSVFRL